MFFVEFGAGLFARSTALLGDSLDMLGDTLVYAFSLYVLNRDHRWLAGSALTKGLVMLAFGVGVLVDAALKLQAGVSPVVPVMVGIGTLALAANTVCFALLWRHRTSDINFRSTWLCSRNDLVANSAVIMAAVLVARSQSVWPDVLVGVAIAGLFLWTAFGVLRESLAELRRANKTFVDSAA
jgi:Co/Zn/Cd efflux system component